MRSPGSAQLGNPYERIGTDRDGRVAIDWGVYGAPESFLINPSGTVVYKHIGAMTPADLAAGIPAAHQRAERVRRRMQLAGRGRRAVLAALLGRRRGVRAVDTMPPLPDPELQQRYYELTHELRCMQCQNESLADSPVGLAADLRLQVRELLLAGQSDEQIRDHMVARYGEFILFRPRMSWRNAWLWALPGVLMLVGLAWRGACCARARGCGCDDDSGAMTTSR